MFVKKILFYVTIFAVCGTAQAKTISLADVEAASQNLQSWQAEFEQITTVESLGENLHKTGTLAAAKPNQFNIAYTSEPQKTYFYNGKTLWVYQPTSQTVMEYKNPSEFISAEALSFLSGVQKLSTLFQQIETKQAPAFKFTNSKLTSIALVPLNSNASIDFLVLGVDTNSNTEEAFLFTPSGNRTHYLFKNVKKNPPLDKALFSWTKQN